MSTQYGDPRTCWCGHEFRTNIDAWPQGVCPYVKGTCDFHDAAVLRGLTPPAFGTCDAGMAAIAAAKTKGELE